MKNIKYSLLLSLTLLATLSFAQEKGGKGKPTEGKGILEGLSKAGPGDIDPSEPIMLDGISIPVYSEKLEKLSPDQLMQVMMGGEYTPEPYIDKKKKIKVFVLRKTTEEERNMIRKMSGRGLDEPSGRDPDIGKEAGLFAVNDLEGNTYTMETLKGKVLVLNFWFVECKPCIMEMPELNRLVEKYKGKDVVFLAFARNKEEQIRKFLKTTPFNYRIVPAATQVAEQYGVMGYPTHFLIDKEGKIRFKALGLGPSTMSDLDQAIGKHLDSGKN